MPTRKPAARASRRSLVTLRLDANSQVREPGIGHWTAAPNASTAARIAASRHDGTDPAGAAVTGARRSPAQWRPSRTPARGIGIASRGGRTAVSSERRTAGAPGADHPVRRNHSSTARTRWLYPGSAATPSLRNTDRQLSSTAFTDTKSVSALTRFVRPSAIRRRNVVRKPVDRPKPAHRLLEEVRRRHHGPTPGDRRPRRAYPKSVT